MNFPADGSGHSVYSQEVFEKLIGELDGQKDTMALAAWIRQPGSGGFGGSPLGRLLAHHTELARGHVVTGVHEVSQVLDAYVNGLKYYKTGMPDTDQTHGATLDTINATTAQVATSLNQTAPDNSAPTPPTLPTTETPGGHP